MLILAFALLAAPLSNSIDQTVALPESPSARAWSSVGPTTQPAPLDSRVVEALSQGAFGSPTWQAWAQVLGEAATSDGPPQRAALCLIARDQGRHLEAWDHYARLVADPSQAAALRQHLWPGVPLAYPALPGGLSPELPKDVLLTPLLPQPSGTWEGELSYAEVLYEMRDSRIAGLRIGGSLFDLRLSVETTGVKLQSWLTSGDGSSFRVFMPEPPGYRIDIEYVDWLKSTERHAARDLTPPPGEEPWTVFSRVSEREVERPRGQVSQLPAALRLGGLTLVDEAPQSKLRLPSATSLQSLIGAPVRISSADPNSTPTASPGFAGVTMRIPADPEARQRALRYLADAIEGLVLTR